MVHQQQRSVIKLVKLFILLSSLSQGVLQNVTWYTCKQIKVLLSHNLFTYSFKWGSHKSLLLTINLHFSKEIDFSGDFPPSLSTFPTYINMKFFIRVELVKENRFTKLFDHCEEKARRKRKIYWICESFYEKYKDFQPSFAN